MELPIYAICLGLGILFTGASLLVVRMAEIRDMEAREDMEHAQSAGVGRNALSSSSPLAIALWLTSFGAFGALFESVDATSVFYLSAPLSALGGVLMTAVVLAWLRKRGRVHR
jgi:hypothetical protein